jgi:murein DD-endopeptidase MepM/ murein hydrolase activator NlpD
MTDVRVSPRTARSWRLATLLMGVLLLVTARLTWDGAQRSSALSDEIGWLRTRLAEKRELIGRQRQEMFEVANAVDRLARTSGTLRERAARARRLAHMEETRDQSFDVPTVKATVDGGESIVSEDAARALEQLAWLDGQAAAASDSFAVLNALLEDRPTDVSFGAPTVWPVRGLVTSPFGARRSPYGEGREMHTGIDISASYGLPVAATGNGEVIFAGRDPGYGGLVVIDHGAQLDTFYGHLSALYVREGQKVHRGQPIGAVGATGRATGAHLHYEVRVNGNPVDPRRYLVN